MTTTTTISNYKRSEELAELLGLTILITTDSNKPNLFSIYKNFELEEGQDYWKELDNHNPIRQVRTSAELFAFLNGYMAGSNKDD